jgi:hypothetical protein
MSIVARYRVLLLYLAVAIAAASQAQDKALIEGDTDKVVNGQGVPILTVRCETFNSRAIWGPLSPSKP